MTFGAARAAGPAAGAFGDDREEIALASYATFAARDLLAGVVLERLLAGVSKRRSRGCQRHKECNVVDQLPGRERAWVRAKLRKAWADPDHAAALASLRALAGQLAKVHPDASGSLREGLEETLTHTRLGVRRRAQAHALLNQPDRVDDLDRAAHAAQRQTLARRRHAPALDRRRNERGAARLPPRQGYRDLPKLTAAIRRELHPSTPTEETATLIAA